MTVVREYKSLIMAADLQQFLLDRQQVELKVHSVFESSINLIADDELVTLAVSKRELMPMGLIVDIADLEILQLESDDLVLYEQSIFHLPRHLSISLQKAEVRKVSLSESFARTAGVKKASLQIIRDKLLKNDNDGIADLAALLPQAEPVDKTLNIYSKYIKEKLFTFLDTIRRKDYEAAVKLAQGLIGFGPGLTPSGDDFIMGIILFLYYVDKEKDFFRQIVTLARQRTTVVSYHMIKNAAAGKAYESYLALIRYLTGEDQDSLETLIDRVLRYGASSGSDFLFGVYCAGLILYERENTGIKD